MEHESSPETVTRECEMIPMTPPDANADDAYDVGIDVDQGIGHEILLDDAAWFE